MGFRFNRRIKILPSVRLNIGKTGFNSVTVGRRGASMTSGKKGSRVNIGTGIPGLSYSARLDKTASAPAGTSRTVKVIVLAIVIALLVAVLSLA